MAYEQVELVFDQKRQEEIDAEKEQKNGFSPVLSPTVQRAAANDSLYPEAEKAKLKPTPEKQGEKREGSINIEHTYVRFNHASNYQELRKSWLNPANISKEATFQNREDGSKITVYKNRVKIDNTPGNIAAALDIAQDKGWDVVKIKGGSKQTQAELWFQANMRGLETSGYKPTQADQKRLLGAKEREAEQNQSADKITESLDIKPRAQTKQKEAEPVADNQKTVQPATDGKNPVHQAAEQAQLDRKETVSQTEKNRLATLAIMTEIKKVMSLNTQEYNDIELAVSKQLSNATKQGKTVDLEQTKKDIKEGLPMVKNELKHAAQTEQTKKKQTEKTEKTQTATADQKPKKDPVQAKEKVPERTR